MFLLSNLLNSFPMRAFLLHASPSKFGRAGREDIWVITQERRCTQSVRHGLRPKFSYQALPLAQSLFI